MENSKLISLLTSTVKEMARPAVNSGPVPRTPVEMPSGLPFQENPDNLQLLQERHDYNMDGLFSPHKLSEEKTDLLWCGQFLLKSENGKWHAIHPGKLIRAFVKEKLGSFSNPIPLMVSEPYAMKGISEKIVTSLNEKGFEFEKLGPETLVMRSIPEWMNGFPLKDIVESLLHNNDLINLEIKSYDWSASVWEDMMNFLGQSRLMEENILCDLEAILRDKLR
jgi:hypothetical protein